MRLGLAPVSVLNAPPIVAQRRVGDGAVGDRQQAAKATPVSADELELARREMEKPNSHLLGADARAAQQREQLEAEILAQETRQADERRAYEAQLLKIATENRADIEALRRESREFAIAVDQVRAESTRTIAQMERRDRNEVDDLTTRLCAGSGTRDPRLFWHHHRDALVQETPKC